MKMYGNLKDIEALMQPGIITQTGFMGEEQRHLPDIIQHDEETFLKLGLDWDDVGNRLMKFEDAAVNGLGEPVTVDEKWLVQSFEARGQLPCPFGDKLLGKNSTQVTLINKGIKIIFSEISLHLLKEHHFLQGRGSDFRLEPQTLKAVLGL